MTLVHSQYPHYTHPDQALEALSARESFKGLVEQWLFEEWNGLPEGVFDPGAQPQAVFARHALSFRMEDAVFFQMAQNLGFLPTFLAYFEDTFTTESSYKRSLMSQTFLKGQSRKGPKGVPNTGNNIPFFSKSSKITIGSWNKRRISEIYHPEKGRLVDFHQSFQQSMLEG